MDCLNSNSKSRKMSNLFVCSSSEKEETSRDLFYFISVTTNILLILNGHQYSSWKTLQMVVAAMRIVYVADKLCSRKRTETTEESFVDNSEKISRFLFAIQY